MSDANVASTNVTVSGNGTLRAVGDVTRLEYSYDHDNAVLEAQRKGYIDAVRFTPLFSDQLIIARFYIFGWYILPNTFKVHVMDASRNDLITPFEQTPTSEGWFDVNLASYDINVNAGTDFYIGLEWIGSDYNPYLGEDRTSHSQRSCIWNGTQWYENPGSDFMIRVVTGPTYDLTISTTAGGSTSPVSGSHTYGSGISVSVQATAGTGFAFDNWTLDGVNAGTANPINVTMNSNHALQAIFSVSTIWLNIVAGSGGTVNPSGTQTLNISQTYQFSANPNSGYGFDHWDLNGQNRGSGNPLTLIVTAAMNGQTLTALFSAVPSPTPPPTTAPTATPPPTTPPPATPTPTQTSLPTPSPTPPPISPSPTPWYTFSPSPLPTFSASPFTSPSPPSPQPTSSPGGPAGIPMMYIYAIVIAVVAGLILSSVFGIRKRASASMALS